MSAYDWVLAAARWAEQNHTPPTFISTAPELYHVAAQVAAGLLDLSDMPEPDAGAPWSSVITYLESKGINVTRAANLRTGNGPLYINGVLQ